MLDGTLGITAQTLHASLRIIRVSDDAAIWSRDFSAPLSSVLSLQQQVADSVLGVLQLQIARRVRTPRSDIFAYDLYSKARWVWEGRTREKYDEAISLYRQAVERDPHFALAWAALAEAYVNMLNFGYMPREQALTAAELASGEALGLDSTLAEAFNARGQLLMS